MGREQLQPQARYESGYLLPGLRNHISQRTPNTGTCGAYQQYGSPRFMSDKYSVTSINYTGRISLIPSLDAVIVNKDDDPNEKIWNILRSGVTKDCAYLWTQTRREDAQVCYAMTYQFFKNGKETTSNPIRIEKEKQTGFSIGADVKPGDNVMLIKYTVISSSLYDERQELIEHSVTKARQTK